MSKTMEMLTNTLKTVFENEQIKILETCEECSFGAVIENKTNRDIILRLPQTDNFAGHENDPWQYEIPANDWTCLIYFEYEGNVKQALEQGDFEVVEEGAIKTDCLYCYREFSFNQDDIDDSGEVDTEKFVAKCGELLNIAKPELIKAEFKLGKEIEVNDSNKQREYYMPEDKYVVITCKSGYTYKLPVSGTSLCGIAETIFSKMLHK